MRIFILYLLCLAAPLTFAQRPLNEQDREVLETRIESLEEQISIQRQTAKQFRDMQQSATDVKVEKLQTEIDSKVWTASALLAALLGALGFLLRFVGLPWAKSQIAARAGAEVSKHLTEEHIGNLVRSQSQPLIQSRTEALEVKLDGIAAKMETDAERRLREIASNWDDFAREEITARATQGESSDGRSEALGRTLESIKPDRADWGWADWMIHGRELISENKWVESIKAIDCAIQLDPEHATAHNNRGHALIALGRYSEAVIALDRARQIEPNEAAIHGNRGSALIGLCRYEEALAAIDRAIQIEPGEPSNHSNRGQALNGLSRYDDALAALDHSNQVGLLHPAPHYHKARAHAFVGQHDAAAKESVKALELCVDLADESYRSAAALYVAAVARLLLGKEASDERSALSEHLQDPFPQRLEWCVFDAPLTDDADIQSAIDELSALLRTHDAEHWPGAKA